MANTKEKTSIQKKEAEKTNALERTRSGKVFLPPVDIYERDDEIVVIADMPGTDEKSLNITLEQNVLTIQAKVEPLVPEGFELQYREYETGDYQRTFTLTDTIDRDKIEASYSKGVLKLRLPKVEPAKPKKIEVKAM